MKNLVTGADALAEALKPRERSSSGRNYFKIDDGEAVTARFLQEMDPRGEGFDESVGTAAIATYVSPDIPEGYRFKYLAEENLEDRVANWTWKTRLLINLLVEVGVDDEGETIEEVQFWDTSKQNARQLLEFHNEDGSIVNKRFKIKRSGADTDTTYMFFPKSEDGGIDVSDYAEQVTQAEDYLRELTVEEIARHEGDDNDNDTQAGNWT